MFYKIPSKSKYVNWSDLVKNLFRELKLQTW